MYACNSRQPTIGQHAHNCQHQNRVHQNPTSRDLHTTRNRATTAELHKSLTVKREIFVSRICCMNTILLHSKEFQKDKYKTAFLSAINLHRFVKMERKFFLSNSNWYKKLNAKNHTRHSVTHCDLFTHFYCCLRQKVIQTIP